MSSKVYDCGLVLCRLQHIHNGHEGMINMTKLMCDRVLCFIGSANESGTKRNPYNISTRIDSMNEIYGDDKNMMIYGLSDLTDENDNCYEWGDYLLNTADRYIYKEPDCMVYGLSKEEAGRATEWFNPNRLETMNFLLMPKKVIPIEATGIRYLLVLNDRRRWQKWTNPKLHKDYPRLRDELMSISYFQELEPILVNVVRKNPELMDDYYGLKEYLKTVPEFQALEARY